MSGTLLLRCRWETAGRRPYFANLKVMRGALGPVRDALGGGAGTLGAYLFFEDRFLLLAEGDGSLLSGGLDRGRRLAEEAFRASDHKPLWGDEFRQELHLPPIRQTKRRAAAAARLGIEVALAMCSSLHPRCHPKRRTGRQSRCQPSRGSAGP